MLFRSNWLYYLLSRKNVPQTIMMSYGWKEHRVPPDYAIYVCNLLAELGLIGASVLVASGNNGVGNGKCLIDNGSGTKSVRFRPTFPSTCACGTCFLWLKALTCTSCTLFSGRWVTSVGGTTGFNPEVAASFSGGGFSNYFPRPRYQDYAVPAYLLQHLGSTHHGLYKCVRYP